MARMRDRAECTRSCWGVGAAFDFHAGLVRQAPPWIGRNGLEWVYPAEPRAPAAVAALRAPNPRIRRRIRAAVRLRARRARNAGGAR